MKRILSFAFLALVLVWGNFACKNESEAKETAQQAQKEVAQKAADAAITTKVKLKFADDTTVHATDVNVDTDNGIVTLTGTVASQAEADRAADIAGKVEGVRTVHSFLKVSEGQAQGSSAVDSAKDAAKDVGQDLKNGAKAVGTAADDTRITGEIKVKFGADDQVSASNIDVTTKNGVVSLHGKVKSAAERDKAVQIAKAIDGVKDVQSYLSIRP
ncbi:MAG TPA: BON domain-containing protein [Acidobacteriota bacterium]|nr:BON domain-containing protein [Acidobacteriota bacterium]